MFRVVNIKAYRDVRVLSADIEYVAFWYNILEVGLAGLRTTLRNSELRQTCETTESTKLDHFGLMARERVGRQASRNY